MRIKTLGIAAAAAACLVTSTSAMAYGAGDFWVRGGWAFVKPTGGHTNLNSTLGSLGARVQRPGNDHGPAFTLGYRFTDHFGAELLAAPSSFHSHYNVKTGADTVARGSTRVLPPTLTAQYYPLGGTQSQIQPYVGVGATYSIYSSNHLHDRAGLGDMSVNMKNTWGWAAQAGVDYMLTKHLGVNAAVWYLDSEPDTKVRLNGQNVSSKRVDVNPVVVMTGLTWRF